MSTEDEEYEEYEEAYAAWLDEMYSNWGEEEDDFAESTYQAYRPQYTMDDVVACVNENARYYILDGVQITTPDLQGLLQDANSNGNLRTTVIRYLQELQASAERLYNERLREQFDEGWVDDWGL